MFIKGAFLSNTNDANGEVLTCFDHLFLTYVCKDYINYTLAKYSSTVCRSSFVRTNATFVSNFT